MPEIDGFTASGFEAVREAFAANLASGQEVGAAVSAYLHGQKIVDLWGGIADPATGLAFGYVMNHIQEGVPDHRAAGLLTAIKNGIRAQTR